MQHDPHDKASVYLPKENRRRWTFLGRVGLLGCFVVALVVYRVVGSIQPSHRDQTADQSAGVAMGTVEDLPIPLVLYDSVFWEPLDTLSLRSLLRETPAFVADKSVLEIGTGSGLLALICCKLGARRVVATDINPHAVECAKYNAQRLGVAPEIRLVDASEPSAFSVVSSDERFHVILSNPPWEDGKPEQWADYALYDDDFRLLRSLLSESRQHLYPNGKLLLAYGCVEAIECVLKLAPEYGFTVTMLDERELDSLPPVFLPGMLLGLALDESHARLK